VGFTADKKANKQYVKLKIIYLGENNNPNDFWGIAIRNQIKYLEKILTLMLY